MPHRPAAPPATTRVEQNDDYHGTSIADPYRWLEDLDSPETAAWVAAQNEVTFAYFDGVDARAQIRARLTDLWNYEKFGLPTQENGRYFLLRNGGLQNQPAMLTSTGIDSEWLPLIDPNTWSPDGTIAMNDAVASNDGRFLAYARSAGGSDWTEWRVMDVDAGADTEDLIEHVKFSRVAWHPDSTGFWYGRFDVMEDFEDRNEFMKLYYHQLGTKQSEDVLVFERPDRADLGFAARVSDDGRFLLIGVSMGTSPKNGVMIQEVGSERIADLLMDFDAKYAFIGNIDRTLYFRTDLDAPRGRVIAIDLDSPERDAWRTIVAEGADTLETASLFGDRLVLNLLRDAKSVVLIGNLDGSDMREVALPGVGTATGFGGRQHHTETFFAFTTFTSPAAIWRLDITTGEVTPFKSPTLHFDPDLFTTEQVFVASKDGTKIPLFISARKDMVRDGTNPTYLYGYGGFNVSMTPAFSVGALAWMERGGVYAVACPRGGGEYGEEWHAAGTLHQKQNVFDDFIACAEHLIADNVTSTPHLGIGGGSNGGLLVGACMTQRPDLFGAVHAAVGVLDMLRFHLFTIGWAWTPDYGSAEDPDMFPTLLAYSPLHTLRDGVSYPATLITTGDHDDRVVPSHSFKFAARLQEAHAGTAPTLIRIGVRAGHGMGKPTSKLIEEATDVWAFLDHQLRA